MFRAFHALCAACAILGLAAAAPAFAQNGNPFARLTGEEAPRAQLRAAWYERADSGGRFVFDRSASPALIWPEDSAEVYAVYANRASGGGQVWMTDTDRALLRFSSLGGATYFPDDKPDGVIVEELGRADALEAEPASAGDLQRAARALADRLARMADTNVTVQVVERDPRDNGYLVDTTRMVRIGAEKASRRALRELSAVRIETGERADARFAEGVLSVAVAPERGYAGRPSSDFIRRVLERGY